MILFHRNTFALAFVAYAGTSVLWTVGDKVLAILHLLSLVAFWFFGKAVKDHEFIWKLFCLIVVALIPVYLLDRTINPNVGGVILVLAFAGALAYQQWLLAPLFPFALFLYPSRNSIVAAAGVAVIAIGRRFPVTAFAVVALGAIAFLAKDNIGVSTLSRLGIWQDTINHMTFFGHGYASFFDAYTAFPVKRNMTDMLAPHAYNDFLEFVFMLGIGAIPLWLYLVAAYEAAGPQARLILLAYALLSLTFFPFWIVGHVVAFTLGSVGNHGEKDEVPIGGTALYRG